MQLFSNVLATLLANMLSMEFVRPVLRIQFGTVQPAPATQATYQTTLSVSKTAQQILSGTAKSANATQTTSSSAASVNSAISTASTSTPNSRVFARMGILGLGINVRSVMRRVVVAVGLEATNVLLVLVILAWLMDIVRLSALQGHI